MLANKNDNELKEFNSKEMYIYRGKNGTDSCLSQIFKTDLILNSSDWKMLKVSLLYHKQLRLLYYIA